MICSRVVPILKRNNRNYRVGGDGSLSVRGGRWWFVVCVIQNECVCHSIYVHENESVRSVRVVSFRNSGV